MKVELSKKALSVIAAYLIVIGVYLIVFLAIPFPKTAASWISIVFTLISFVFSLAVCLYAFKDNESLTSKVYGFPIFRVGYLYAGAQFVKGVLICVLGAFLNVPWWIAFVLSVVLLGAASIGVVAADNIKDVVVEQDETVQVQTKVIRTFTVDLSYASTLCTNSTLSKALEKLAEEFKYSDPVSSDATEEIEKQLKEEVTKLETLLKDNLEKETLEQIEKVNAMLLKRNKIAKENK